MTARRRCPRLFIAGLLLVAGCTPPPGTRPDLPPGAATGTVIVYRERSFWTLTPALFGEGRTEYLGLAGGEYGEVEVPAGTHRFRTWAYFGWREEWRPHATLDLSIEPNSRTCIKAHAKGPLIVFGMDFVGKLIEMLVTPFRSRYEMETVPCTRQGPPPGYVRAERNPKPKAMAPAAPILPAPPPATVAPPAPTFSVGQHVALAQGAALRRQPKADAEPVGEASLTRVTLKAPLANADGRWWYVTAEGTSGWVREADLRSEPSP